MVTGWLHQGEYSYYLQEDGSAAVGPTKIGYYTHYFTPRGIHVVLVNASHALPPYYEMDLVTVTGWHQVSSVCLEPLKQMLADCNAAGISYNFNSAHRTVEEQTMILEQRTQEDMENLGLSFEAARAKALQTVAYPGTSEHHLGLAVDLLGDATIEWLTEHCWEYGFIVRYTADKYAITGIVNEPWHFRYVGTEVSLDMKDSGLCLEEYLGAVTKK
jgi:D-alanyl-D-alanine carboxypeptidase